MKKLTILVFASLLVVIGNAQPWFKRVDSVAVKINNKQLLFPWAGGLNFCQFSTIDLNQDGIKDLFVFDKTGFKISTYINNGTPGEVDYVFAPEYKDKFPPLEEWGLLVDYNCDGKEDIFAHANGGIAVYRNDSDPINGLKFTLITPLLKSRYSSSNYVNLYISSVDIPAISDIDGDGDLDVATFSIFGTFMEYHQNMSMETKGNCDTLDFKLATSCWGNFTENSFDNKINLNQACKVGLYSPNQIDPLQIQHSGSCEVCFDIDGDGDKDILIGGISSNNLTLVTNGGTSSNANMIAHDPAFPPSLPVDLTVFPCAYYLDVDNDGLDDLLVSPNAENASENFTSVLMYKNTGSSNGAEFTYIKNNFLQDQMIDVGEGAVPVFFDYDGDGLKDLLVSNYKYFSSVASQSKIALFKNLGTSSKPAFELVTRDFSALATLNIFNMIPAFGDLDGDGDLDMMIGDEVGRLHYFSNTPSAGVANFALSKVNYTDNTATIIDVGNYAAPQLIDLDRDNKLDLIIGASSGKITYYRNTGTINAPVFTKITSNLGDINVVRKSTFSITGYSIPYLYSDAGNYKLLVGSESGYLYYYNNIDGNLAGTFTLVDSSYQKIWEGSRTAPTGADINNDGLIDLAIGNYAGGLSLFYGQATNSTYSIQRNITSFNLYPNPVSDELTIELKNNNETVIISIIDMIGREIRQIETTDNLIKLNVSNLAPGVYLCKLRRNALWNNSLYQFQRFVIR